MWILLVYYRIYDEDGAIPLKTPVAAPVALSDPFLGRIRARSVPPPRIAETVKCTIATLENIKDGESTSLFLTPYSESPMGDADKVIILNGPGPGSTPQEVPGTPSSCCKDVQLQAKCLGVRRKGWACECWSWYNLPRDKILYVLYMFSYFSFCNILTVWESLLSALRQQSWDIIKSSLPLVVSGLTLLPRHIVPPLLNDAFREWRKTQHLPSPIFSQRHHPMLNCEKATSHSFPLTALTWVWMSQWPLFKDDQSRTGCMSLKIEQRTFFGARGKALWNWSVFIPLQSRMRRNRTTCRWTIILQLFNCSEDNSISKWDITRDANGYISMTSPYAPSSWVGAEIQGSTVPVPWRLIPADRKSY